MSDAQKAALKKYKSKGKRQFSILMPVELMDRVDDAATRICESRARFIRQALEEKLSRTPEVNNAT